LGNIHLKTLRGKIRGVVGVTVDRSEVRGCPSKIAGELRRGWQISE
jgi:hypothetical protein